MYICKTQIIDLNLYRRNLMPDLTSLAAPAATLLKKSGQKIAVAESSCGGLISAALVSIPGASDYYVGGSTI